MRKLFFVLLVAIALIAPVGLFAQTSNTFSTTEGIFKTDVDKAFSTTDYSEFSGALAFALLNLPLFSAGFSDHLGGFYFGGYYTGNMFGDSLVNLQQFTTTYTLNVSNAVAATTVDSLTRNDDTIFHKNMGEAIVGFGPIGILAGFYETTNVSNVNFAIPTAYGFGSASAGWTLMGNPNSANGLFTTNLTQNTLINTTGTPFNNDLTQTTDAAGTVIGETSTAYDVGSYGTPLNNDINPWLTLGAKLNLGSMALKPFLSFGVAFVNGSESAGVTTYTKLFGNNLPTYATITDVQTYDRRTAGYGGEYTELSGAAGATLVLGSSNATEFEISASYMLGSLPLYNNAYTDLAGAAQTAAGEVWTYSDVSYTANPSVFSTTTVTTDAIQTATHQYMKHEIFPGFLMRSKVSDALSFGFSVMPSVKFSNETIALSGTSRQTTVFVNDIYAATPSADYTMVENKTFLGNTLTTTTFSVNAPLNAAIEYYVVPAVLRLNGGVTVTLPAYTSTMTTTTRSGLSTDQIVQTYGDGHVVTAYTDSLTSARVESQNATSGFSNAAVGISVGATWFLTKDIALDVMAATSLTSAADIIDLTKLTAQLSVKL